MVKVISDGYLPELGIFEFSSLAGAELPSQESQRASMIEVRRLWG